MHSLVTIYINYLQYILTEWSNKSNKKNFKKSNFIGWDVQVFKLKAINGNMKSKSLQCMQIDVTKNEKKT